MTNREKYAEEILDIALDGNPIAIQNNKPVRCNVVSCLECDLYCGDGESCSGKLKKWANQEYVQYVDWSKVAVDTPILVSDDEDWNREYFAKYENGVVFAWIDGRTSWTTDYTVKWKYAKLAE